MTRLFQLSIDRDDTKVQPELIKERIGMTVSFSCHSSEDAEWFYHEILDMPLNVNTNFDGSVLTINQLNVLNSGVYNCYGFDQYQNPKSSQGTPQKLRKTLQKLKKTARVTCVFSSKNSSKVHIIPWPAAELSNTWTKTDSR